MGILEQLNRIAESLEIISGIQPRYAVSGTKEVTDKQEASKKTPEMFWTPKLSIAYLIGKKHAIIKDFLCLLLENFGTSNTLEYSVEGKNNNELTILTQLCTMLLRTGMLQQYKYEKGNQNIVVRVSDDLQTLYFLKGDWIADYIKTTMKIQLDKVREARPNLNVTETVLAGKLLGPEYLYSKAVYKFEDKVLWVDGQAGSYQQFLQDFVVAKSNAVEQTDQLETIIVLTDIITSEAEIWSNLYGFKVVAIQDFETEIESYINKLV